MEPIIIENGIFRESSRDSIMEIINSIENNKVIKIHDEYSYWKTHKLYISNGTRKIKFEVDYSFDSPIHEVLRILNSYIPESDNKLELF